MRAIAMLCLAMMLIPAAIAHVDPVSGTDGCGSARFPGETTTPHVHRQGSRWCDNLGIADGHLLP